MSERNLREMPDGLFDAIPVLSHLHLGTHQHLAQLPRVDALGNLKSLTLALMHSLQSLPDLTGLARVQEIQLLIMPKLDALPDLAAGADPSKFLVQLARVCCNGFLGACSPSHAACRDLTDAQCSGAADRPSGSLERVLEKHKASVCSWDAMWGAIPVDIAFTDPPRRQIDKCGGVLYRQCEPDDLGVPRGQSLCYNSRLMAVACVTSPDVVSLRRAEIRAGVGPQCDPLHEAWLGCGS